MNINAQTQKFGIIGNPLGHTFSPAMHNAAFEATGFNGVYLAFPVKNLIRLKHSIRQLDIKGLSVTIPYKIRVRKILDNQDPLALQIGSVNTLLWDKRGLLTGHNTDGLGALRAIADSGYELKDKKVLILGSGGSARAIAFSLLKENPAGISIATRNPRTGRNLIRSLAVIKKRPTLELLLTDSRPPKKKRGPRKGVPHIHRYEVKLLKTDTNISDYDLIINTTPMGMSGHPAENLSFLQADDIHSHQVCFDIVYNPIMTPLLKMARKKKASIITGEKMLLYQGALQFEMFTGLTAPVEIMDKVLRRELRNASK